MRIPRTPRDWSRLELEKIPAIRRGLARAERASFTVEFRQFVEDARTPGIAGMIGGRCDLVARHIVVGTNRRSALEIAAILEHECEHAEGREVASDCPRYGLRCGEFHVPEDPREAAIARREAVTRAVAAHCETLPLRLGQVIELCALARAAERAGFSAAAAVALGCDRADKLARGEIGRPTRSTDTVTREKTDVDE